MLIITNPQIQTIIEQLCFGRILSENSRKHAKHLAFISIDDAIMTCISSYIATKNKDTKSNDFDIWLDLLEKDNKITVYEKNDIKEYHNARENILNHHDLLMMKIDKKIHCIIKNTLSLSIWLSLIKIRLGKKN
jgi:hypothetical protein